MTAPFRAAHNDDPVIDARMPSRHSVRGGLVAFVALLLGGTVLFGTVAFPDAAVASEGEAALSLSTGYTQIPRGNAGMQFGAGAQVLTMVGVSDFFALRAGAETGYMFGREFENNDNKANNYALQNVFFGLRYNLDIFKYVPYIALSGVLHQRGPPPAFGKAAGSTLGAKATVGLDWRFSRNWSVGGRAELHTIASNPRKFPSMATVQAVLSYHFRL